MLKPVRMLCMLASALLLAACATPKPNPEFRECANACTRRQDACMVNATTSADVSRCHVGLDACVAGCERKFPRYMQP